MINFNACSYALTLTLGFAAACSGKSALGEDVSRHCSKTEATLRLALDRSRAGEDVIVGLGDLRNPDVSLHLLREFSFCAEVRAGGGGEAFANGRDEFTLLSQQLGESRDFVTRERALGRMLVLFSKVDSYPLK